MGPKPDPRRRSPSSRPVRRARAGPSARSSARSSAKPSAKPAQTSARAGRDAARTLHEHVVEPIKRHAAESAELRSEQRLGFTARRAAVLAGVVCVLTLTIAGPVRTYFAQRTEMEQLAASEAALRHQIADLEQKRGKLSDPAYIAAQARERLGFVMPGDTPFQVQLPPTGAVTTAPGEQTGKPIGNDPWYTSLWHTIADAPHLQSAPPTVIPPAAPEPADVAPPAAPNPAGPRG